MIGFILIRDKKKKEGEEMPVTKAHIRATTKYENKSYDKICIRIRKDADITRDKLQKAADAAGESLNGYVMEAVRQRMKNTDKEDR